MCIIHSTCRPRGIHYWPARVPNCTRRTISDYSFIFFFLEINNPFLLVSKTQVSFHQISRRSNIGTDDLFTTRFVRDFLAAVSIETATRGPKTRCRRLRADVFFSFRFFFHTRPTKKAIYSSIPGFSYSKRYHEWSWSYQHVIPVQRTRHLERQLAVAADLRQRHGLALPLDLLALTVASLAGYFDRVRRTVHVVIREFQIHDVVSRLGGPVRDVQRAVFVVLALDLRFAGTLDGERQSAVACV